MLATVEFVAFVVQRSALLASDCTYWVGQGWGGVWLFAGKCRIETCKWLMPPLANERYRIITSTCVFI